MEPTFCPICLRNEVQPGGACRKCGNHLAELPATFSEELTPEGIQLAMFPPADPKPRKGDSTAQLALW